MQIVNIAWLYDGGMACCQRGLSCYFMYRRFMCGESECVFWHKIAREDERCVTVCQYLVGTGIFGEMWSAITSRWSSTIMATQMESPLQVIEQWDWRCVCWRRQTSLRYLAVALHWLKTGTLSVLLYAFSRMFLSTFTTNNLHTRESKTFQNQTQTKMRIMSNFITEKKTQKWHSDTDKIQQ